MARTTVEAQLVKLRKAKAEIEKREKALLNKTQGKAIEKIVQIATDNAITVQQITDALKEKAPRKAKSSSQTKGIRRKVAPKYRNPAIPDQTWSGRGRTPLWIQALQKTCAIETALIKA